MASAIDATKPVAGSPTTASVRDNFATAASEITALQTKPNQTITLLGDIAGSGTAIITTTLPTVNANVGTFQGLAINAKGQVTAAANQSYVTGGPYLPTAGGNITGPLNVSGNVGIGTTAPQYGLDVIGAVHASAQGNLFGGLAGSMASPTNANTNLLVYSASATNYAGIGADPGGTMYFVTGTSAPASRLVVSPTCVGLGKGATAPSNNITLIDNAVGSALGYPVRIGNNNATAGDNVAMVGGGPNASDTTTKLIGFYDYNGNTLQGAITRNGTAAVAYGTASDQRLKEQITDSTLGLDALMRFKVRDYRMKGDTGPQQGLVAQELAKVYPEAVTQGGKDAEKEPWLVDYGRLTPLLIKAVQDLAAKVDALSTPSKAR